MQATRAVASWEKLRARALAPTLTEHERDVLILVDVVDAQPGQLGESHPGVDEQAQDRDVANILEGLGRAGLEQRAELLLGEHGRAFLGNDRRLHTLHGRRGDLPLVNEEVEEHAQRLVAGVGRRRLVIGEERGQVRLDVLAMHGHRLGRHPRGGQEGDELVNREQVLVDRRVGPVGGAQGSLVEPEVRAQLADRLGGGG